MAEDFGTACLSIAVEEGDDQPLLSMTGESQGTSITDILQLLDDLAAEYDSCVPLDLGGVDDLDTDTLRGLATIALALRDHGKRLRLTSAGETVRDTIDRLLLSDVFCLDHQCIRTQDSQRCPVASEDWTVDIFTLPCVMSYCQEARARALRVAEFAGVSKSCRDDITLAIGEAVANAIEHGSSKCGGDPITVSCLATPEKVSISVSDNGPGFSPESVPGVDESAIFRERGRGIHCMHAVMDEVSFRFERGTTVQMVKR